MQIPPVRVLIVDDEPNQRRSLAIGLRLEQFEVSEAADGAEALAFFDDGGDVDFAIIDLMMPGINGLDLARRLRRACPRVRVLLTSAYHLSERQVARANVGAIGFLPKPYHMDELVAFLRRKEAEANARAV